MFFDESRPDRKKRARIAAGPYRGPRQLAHSPVPPAKAYGLLSRDEVMFGPSRVLVFDVESYVNYFLVAFKCLETNRVFFFEDYGDVTIPLNDLAYILQRHLLVGFNSQKYDIPMLMIALQGVRAWKLKQISDEIILGGLQTYEIEQRYGIETRNFNHIDLIEVAPISASLKIYSGRLHCERMQDLPYPPDAELEPWQIINVRDYCVNDLDNTQLLYENLKPQIELRVTLGKEYGIDLRSKSDAQIAEAVIKSELEKLGVDTRKPQKIVGQTFYYQVPAFVNFKTPLLQQVLHTVATTLFEVGESGKANCPETIKRLKINIGSCTYQMGNGGLHSSEKSVGHVADAHTLLIDRDVASYYPQIVLNQGLYPEHLGPAFLEVYRSIVLRRLKAKRDKNTVIADALKITINGAFGKLGSQYSRLYSSDLMSQVTITGQLCLLMLIEAIELAGIPVVSANTDGIVIKCPENRYKDLEHVVIAWEEQTGFVTEETQYKALYCRDVNNYIAVKKDNEGSCKVKGIYSEKGSALNSVLSKNPECLIVSDAVQAFLARGVPMVDTITACSDVRRFVAVRQVKGGAEKNGVYLGKAVRWYYAKDEVGQMNYVITGNAVPKSEGAKPLMNLTPDVPDDLDYDYYINEANETLYDIGYYQRAHVARLF